MNIVTYDKEGKPAIETLRLIYYLARAIQELDERLNKLEYRIECIENKLGEAK